MSKKNKPKQKRKWTVLGDWVPAADFLLELGIAKESKKNPLLFVKGEKQMFFQETTSSKP